VTANADSKRRRLLARRASLEEALGGLGLVLEGYGFEREGFSFSDPRKRVGASLDASAAEVLLPLLMELSRRRAGDDGTTKRLRKALERVASLSHDVGCRRREVPLFECGCFEKSPRELAEMALDGVDWEPAARKARALLHLDVPEDVLVDSPYWQATRLLRDSVDRLPEAAFDDVSLDLYDVLRLAAAGATPAERAKLRQLADADDDCHLFKDALDSVERLTTNLTTTET